MLEEYDTDINARESALWETAVNTLKTTTREERRIRYITLNRPEPPETKEENQISVRAERILLPAGLIGVGLCGAYLTTLPPFSGYLIAFGAMAFFGEVVYWPVLLKAVRLLGNRDEQGRMFGFLEAGRGVVDVLIASGALFVFVQFGEGKASMQAGLVYYTLITIIVGTITYFIVDADDRTIPQDDEDVNKQIFKGIKNVVKSPNLWLASFCIFFVYSAYCGLTYFIPFLKDIYALPVALVGAYGIINQYGLKMVGGPVGGYLADKVRCCHRHTLPAGTNYRSPDFEKKKIRGDFTMKEFKKILYIQ